jgi:hypothetical protein
VECWLGSKDDGLDVAAKINISAPAGNQNSVVQPVAGITLLINIYY